MTTIRKVAKAANVSIATVSRVLNNQPGVSSHVRSRVLESVNRCGYVASVGRRVTSFLALIYTGPSSLGSPYDAAVCAGMVAAMDESDFDLVILNLQRDKKSNESYTQFFHRKGVRGVILRTTKRTRSVCETIADEGFPCIVVGDRFARPDLSYVYCDSRSTSYQGVEHLLALGHRRIALAISDLVEDSDHADRLSAYESALEDHGIPRDRRLYFRIPPGRPDGAQVIRKMMSMAEPPTAVFFTDPSVAVGALIEAHGLGMRIPQDLSILGFDDSELRHQVFPRMTSICQDARRLGHEAFSALGRIVSAQQTDGEPPVSGQSQQLVIREAFPTWLEVNATTGQPSESQVRILPDGTRMMGK